MLGVRGVKGGRGQVLLVGSALLGVRLTVLLRRFPRASLDSAPTIQHQQQQQRQQYMELLLPLVLVLVVLLLLALALALLLLVLLFLPLLLPVLPLAP